MTSRREIEREIEALADSIDKVALELAGVENGARLYTAPEWQSDSYTIYIREDIPE